MLLKGAAALSSVDLPRATPGIGRQLRDVDRRVEVLLPASRELFSEGPTLGWAVFALEACALRFGCGTEGRSCNVSESCCMDRPTGRR